MRCAKLRQQLDFSLLRDGRVRRLTLAHLTSASGDGIILAALPFAINSMGGSDGQFSLALATQGLTMAVIFLPSGVIGDRFNRRSVVIVSDLMRFVARGAFAVLLATGHAEFWQLLVAQAINGTGTALFSTTMDGFIPEVFDDESRLQKINAFRVLALSLGLTLGPAIGGLVYAGTGVAATFAVDALTFLASAALIYKLPTPFALARQDPTTLRALANDVWDGWHAFRTIRWYWRVSVAFAVTNTLVFAPYFIIGPHVAMESLGGASAWSAILVGIGIGELVGSIALMIWEPRRPLVFATAVIAAWPAPILLMAALAPVGFQFGGALLAGSSLAMFTTIWETIKQTQTPPHLRARLGSFDNLGSLGPVPFGYILGGVALSALGSQAALAVMAAILAVTTFWLVTNANVRAITSGSEDPPTIARVTPEAALAMVAGE